MSHLVSIRDVYPILRTGKNMTPSVRSVTITVSCNTPLPHESLLYKTSRYDIDPE